MPQEEHAERFNALLRESFAPALALAVPKRKEKP
jgi:hypothetical protein